MVGVDADATAARVRRAVRRTARPRRREMIHRHAKAVPAGVIKIRVLRTYLQPVPRLTGSRRAIHRSPEQIPAVLTSVSFYRVESVNRRGRLLTVTDRVVEGYLPADAGAASAHQNESL